MPPSKKPPTNSLNLTTRPLQQRQLFTAPKPPPSPEKTPTTPSSPPPPQDKPETAKPSPPSDAPKAVPKTKPVPRRILPRLPRLPALPRLPQLPTFPRLNSAKIYWWSLRTGIALTVLAGVAFFFSIMAGILAGLLVFFLTTGLDSRYLAVAPVLLIIALPILLQMGEEQRAEEVAVWVFSLLVVVAILQINEYRRSPS